MDDIYEISAYVNGSVTGLVLEGEDSLVLVCSKCPETRPIRGAISRVSLLRALKFWSAEHYHPRQILKGSIVFESDEVEEASG